ncbi:MBL fold metallo-hydrolase [Alkaliphilus transvaalensis]|uniref:MBL fold metallo-hydrolase n=1 Tax=Alkaliphilus transvaalensis TaxID=114628 RepID=UPI00054D24EB|nr:MBL fold metallo-hydrolase [Alkaliphilus transvaalensis]
MDMVKGKIHHLYHSGFAVETENYFLIFDYYMDEVEDNNQVRSLEKGVINPDLLKHKKNVIVFVSHNHGDHFNPVIFNWQEVNPDITYILGDDCIVPSNIRNIYVMRTNQSLELQLHNLVKVKTYGTTDRGVSFLVEVDHLSIYHGGDLNWWHWKSFTPEAQLKEEEDFKKEVNQITESIDIAFVPVDPRLEEYYYLGGEYFAHTIKPKLLIPMHFASNFKITEEFANKVSNISVPTIVLKERGQVIEYIKA